MSRVDPARREFLGQIGRTGLALAGASAGAWWLHNRPAAVGEPFLALPRYLVPLGAGDPRLAIVHGTAIDTMVRAAVGELGGMSRFVSAGDVVLIKPNVAFDRAPTLGATTHPDILTSVIRLCREAGASRVIVADNPINDPEGAFRKSGIEAAAGAAGAEVVYPRQRAFRAVKVGGLAIDTWPVFHEPLRDATKVIGVAPAKSHNLCGASLTMKNWYGLLGGARNRFHQRIHDVVADLAALVTPTLVFLDATRILMTNGPTGGRLSDVVAGNTVVCGVDQVAVDAYGVTLLGSPADVAYLDRAHARGIGSMHWSSLAYREMTV